MYKLHITYDKTVIPDYSLIFPSISPGFSTIIQTSEPATEDYLDFSRGTPEVSEKATSQRHLTASF